MPSWDGELEILGEAGYPRQEEEQEQAQEQEEQEQQQQLGIQGSRYATFNTPF